MAASDLWMLEMLLAAFVLGPHVAFGGGAAALAYAHAETHFDPPAASIVVTR